MLLNQHKWSRFILSYVIGYDCLCDDSYGELDQLLVIHKQTQDSHWDFYHIRTGSCQISLCCLTNMRMTKMMLKKIQAFQNGNLFNP